MTHTTTQTRLFYPAASRILAFFWCVYIILSPFYIFESGLPQPADFLIILTAFAGCGIYMLRHPLSPTPVFVALGGMVALFGLINTIYAQTYPDITFYYSSAYYCFNAFVFALTVFLCRNATDRFAPMTYRAILTAIVIQFLWLMLFDLHTDTRPTGSFNNPNQLGYWALLSAACLVVIRYTQQQRFTLPDILCLALCGFMVLESQSRAAIFGFIPILIPVFAGRRRISLLRVMFTILCFLTVIIGQMLHSDSLETRLNLLDTASDPTMYTERGYDRLWENPAYLITGSGEGAYYRFMEEVVTSGYSGLEIHSGLATLLFSYGLFGCVLFLTFLVLVFRHAPPMLLFTLAAIMAYGLTHQHVRFTGFWIYLGLVYGLSHYNNRKKSHDTPA